MYKMRATKTHTHAYMKRIKIINYFNSGITVRGLARLSRVADRIAQRGGWRGAFIMRTINAAAGTVAT